ncbi:sensor histidine kinase [Noviherbaspirillum soli]|uniref:sensor histidine kinase n=1 Tax=Noviherbaspirillum soli TaxID=1064518 RepID=UPI00188A4FB7|nr:sensor histidine kinase [Noviherbaspirillum soli]
MRFIKFNQLRLSTQFLIASFPVIGFCTLLIGLWISNQVKIGIAHRLGSETAIYVDEYISKRIEFFPGRNELTLGSIHALDSLLVETSLKKKVNALYLWGADGKIIYSQDKNLIGKVLTVDEGLEAAYAGNISSIIKRPSDDVFEKDLKNWSTLIESYVPIRRDETEDILAVAEFFLATEELDREAKMAETQSWLIVAAVFGLAYLLLFKIVRNGSNVIDSQREDLKAQLALVTALNDQNVHLREKVSQAAARVTTLNEDFLHRISADLHDGPAQDLGLALMNVKTLCDTCEDCPKRKNIEQKNAQESPTVLMLLQSALSELRSISAGLQLPNLSSLGTNQIIARAINDYQAKVNVSVDLTLPEEEREASLPVKITLYRILQESLSNGYRHANGINQKVFVRYEESRVHVDITDGGQGFDINAIPEQGHLGIKGMRERIEVLGGNFKLDSSPGDGTAICVDLPLVVPGDDHA